jgi:RecJ-like exonuclease
MAKQCARCDGKGTIECPKCDGSGKIDRLNYMPVVSDALSVVDDDFTAKDECSKCDGTGEVACPGCDGAGEV